MSPDAPAGAAPLADAAPLVDVVKRDWLPPSETFLRTQTGALRRWRHRCVGFERVPGPLERADDVLVDGLPGLGRLWTATPPDLVHVHWATEGVGLLPLLDRHDLPLVVTVHGLDVSRRRFGTDEAEHAHRADVRRVLRRAARVVAPSFHLASRAVAVGAPPERVTVAYIGVPLPPEPSTVSEPLAVPEADAAPDPDVAVVARLVPVKGVADVIRACALAASALGRPVTLRVVGDGPLRPELERLAADSRGVHARFLGALPHAEVLRTLAAARVVAGGSRVDADGAREGFGLGLLEASSLGRPVVAYDSGGVAEAVLHEVTGLLVPEGDVDALGAALARLLAEPGLADGLGRAGRARVAADLDVALCTPALERVYDEVLAGARREVAAP